jgi:hypothetical protein
VIERGIAAVQMMLKQPYLCKIETTKVPVACTFAP